MIYILGLQTGNNDYRLQHIVANDKGQYVAKDSDIVFWTVINDGRATYYCPISKVDLESNTIIVPAQLYNCIHDRTRRLIKVTDTGKSILPYGVIIKSRR